MEIKEGRISNSTLRDLCVKNDWFTEGDIGQYDKLFRLNEMQAPIEHLSVAIWMCSDTDKWSRKDILVALNEAGFTERCSVTEKKRLERWLGI